MISHESQEEIYIERSKAEQLKVSDITNNVEYHICDRNDGSRIIINGNAFFLIKRIDKIEVCAIEDVLVKYWDHEYISSKLWFTSYEEAVESNDKFYSVFKDVDPYQIYSMLYMFSLPLSYDTVLDVIQEADSVINEAKKEAKSIAKRKLLKYFND